MTMNLENARYINFSTLRKNGNTVDTPVWFVKDEDKYYIYSTENAGKVKRLRNFSKSRIAPCDAKGKLLGEWSNTQASIIELPEEKQHVYHLLMKKYGWQMRILNIIARLSGKINQRCWIVIQME